MVVSDSLAGIELQFGDAVVACPDRDTLLATVTALLSDEPGRTARAARGREAVLEHHTFERRVDTLLERVLARREELGFRLRVRPAA
jgi:spore maturation protein CgeB